MSKRIVFSNLTPNDQGGIIPNSAIDFSRFMANPVILKQHNWNGEPLGLMTDIKLEGGNWTGSPTFHKLTQESKDYAAMYEGGWLRACSIGGEAIWKANAAGQYQLDKNGLKLCEKFYLYEISMVTLPSNPDAVQLGNDVLSSLEDNKELLYAKIYEQEEKENVFTNIITLSSKFKITEMAKEKTPEEIEADKMAAIVPEPVIEDKDKSKHVILESNLPKFLKDIVGFMSEMKSMFAGDPIKDAPLNMTKEPDGDEPIKVQTPKKADIAPEVLKPIGLKAKKAEEAEAAKKEAEEATKKAAKAVEETEAAKKAMEADDTEAAKTKFEACTQEAEKAVKEAEEAKSKYEAAKKAEDDEPEEKETEKVKEKTKNNAMPELKTPEQLRIELTLAAAPEHKVKIQQGAGVSFSKLSAKGNKEGEQILNRVITKDGGQKSLADYAIVLNSIMADSKFAAVVEKVRIMQNVNEAALGAYASNPAMRAGISLAKVAANLNSGVVEMMGRNNVMQNITTLSTSDDALATPDTLAVEWLALAIFKLFPTTSWKNDIPIFGAQDTGNNLGIIWTNIMADPTIYKGTKPTPGNYTYADQAVALKLVPYWMQPMLWVPLTMHMLRYDQMATGWAQAFAKWASVMDDDLLYTLASTVPAASVVNTSGAAFNIASSASPDAFY